MFSRKSFFTIFREYIARLFSSDIYNSSNERRYFFIKFDYKEGRKKETHLFLLKCTDIWLLQNRSHITRVID